VFVDAIALVCVLLIMSPSARLPLPMCSLTTSPVRDESMTEMLVASGLLRSGRQRTTGRSVEKQQVGADFGAADGAERHSARLSCCERLGATGRFSRLYWSEACRHFLDTKELAPVPYQNPSHAARSWPFGGAEHGQIVEIRMPYAVSPRRGIPGT
jgi:hypothetical protein